MLDAASTISAIGAALAALLAGLNLYYSGRREHAKWARETLAELYVAYLDASFKSSYACRQIFRRIEAPATAASAGDEELHAQIGEAHADQVATLTRLRLLSSRSVVHAAVALHEANHAFADLATAQPASSRGEMIAARDAVWQRRQEFLTAAKRTLGLRGSLASVMHHAPSPSLTSAPD